MSDTVFLNWAGPAGRETVDEMPRGDHAPGREGFRAWRAYIREMVAEYHLAGMAVYTSSRPCANWKD